MSLPVALNHRCYGDDGPAVLILHGLFGSARNWHTQARALAGQFRVFAVDLRNHGSSPHVDTMDYPSMAADVQALLDARELPAAHLIGHSMGGKVAMQLALNAPQRVARLVVVDIAPRSYAAHHDTILTALQGLDLGAHAGREAFDGALRAAIPDAGVRQFMLSNLVRAGDGFAWRFNLAAIVKSYQRLLQAPHGPAVFGGPALFIKGGRSDYLVENDRRRVGELFPAAHAKIIGSAGHWPHAEKPQIFAKLVREFLTEAITEGVASWGNQQGSDP